MLTNTELKITEKIFLDKSARSLFFWNDTKIFDQRLEQNFNTLIALRQILGYRQDLGNTEIEKVKNEEFLEIYDRIATAPALHLNAIWSDPAAYHWCQLAFDLVKATLSGKPLSLARSSQKTALPELIIHLDRFKLFAIAHWWLSGQSYQFKTPLIVSLPLALPGTALYIEGEGEIEIQGIESGKLEIILENQKKLLELTPGTQLTSDNLQVGQCPTLQLQSWTLRFQPYCFNSAAFPDGEAVVAVGMAYQAQYTNLIRDGLALVERHQPQTFEQLHYFMQVLALKPVDVGAFNNLSSSDLSGALICSVIENPYRLADSLIHEFHHNRLFSIEQNQPLLVDSVTDADGNNLYYSPWRFDLRPLRGILHAVYVYTPVLRFWLQVYRGQPTGELLDFATSQLTKIPLQLRMGLEQLHKHARLTPLGQELLTELEEQFAVLAEEIAHLPLPTDVPDLDFQRDGSFVYNLRPETRQLLTVKAAISSHLQRFDRDGQIGRELQLRLGLDTSTPSGEDKKPAIAYGEKIAGNFQVISSLGATLQQEITRLSESQLLDLSTDTAITRTYGDLWQQSQSLLGYLQQQGLSPGDLVILQLESCHDLVVAAWSCFAGGFIPVPVSNSLDSWKTQSGKTKLERLWQTLDRPVILTTSSLEATIKNIFPENPTHLLTLEAAQGFPPSDNFHSHQPEDLALLLTTSGTTGHPKLIAFDAITVISQFLSANRKSENYSRFLTWLPLDNASGFSIVNPRAGLTLYLPPERFFGNLDLWWQTIDQYQVRETLLTNFAMAQITERMQAIPRPNCDLSSLTTISLGAEKIVARTCRSFLQTLQPLGLRSDIFNIAYGLSETGVIASTRQWMAMADNIYGEQLLRIGQPLPGCGIRIVDRENNLLNEGEIGRIQVWGVSSSGYYHNPTLNRQLFTEDDWLDTGDLGFLDQGYLTVTGREKETIIINGKNYSCQEIEIMVEEVPGVQPAYTVACSVRLRLDDTDELAIFFHPREDSLLDEVILEIRRKIAQNFGINPTYIIGVEKSAIPRTATGKIQRLQLKQDLETGAFATLIAKGEAIVQRALEKTFVEPRNPLEQQLTQIWEQVLERKPIGIYNNFFDLGGDSISAVKLLAAIETSFGKDLTLAALLQAPTVEKLAQILSREQWSSSSYSLVPIQPLGDRNPLFAIHLLGEGLSFYRPLAGYLGLEQPIYGLNYGLAARKSGEKEASLPPIEELAAHYIQEMQTVQPQGPYILLGVSNGGNVAFEMAKQLYQQGETVARLILFDTIHPQVKLSENWQNLSSFQKMILQCRRTIDIHWGNLWLFPPEERLPYIINQVKNLWTQKLPRLGQILSSAIGRLVAGETKEPEKIKSQSPSYRQYIPKAYPGKIVLFKAKYSTLLPLEPSNGWQGVAKEGLEIYNVHGAHSKILSEPSVRVLSKKLQDCLDKIN